MSALFPRQAQILDAIRLLQPVAFRVLHARFGGHREALSWHLQRMRLAGHLEVQGTKKGAKWRAAPKAQTGPATPWDCISRLAA